MNSKNENINKILEVWKSINIIGHPIKDKLQLEIINQIASAFAVGKYYYMVLNFTNLSFEFVSPGVKTILGLDEKEFSLNTFFNLVHPNDLIKFHEKENMAGEFLFNKIPKEDIPFYKMVYLIRIKDVNGKDKTLLHQARAISVSTDGKIERTIIVHSDVTFLDIPYNHNISFISQEKESYFATEKDGSYSYNKKHKENIFSRKEIEIIKNISEGYVSKEIANILFVSQHTVNYHKKNILKKSGCKNTAELIAKSIREGII
ncbi:MAG: LuxR C-terminal-related transcriptional regulator [Melioribacteraceae bacterium]